MEMDPNRPLGEDSEPLLSNSNSTAQPDTEQVPTITESKTQPRHGATSSVTVITSQPRFHSLKQCSSEVAKAGEHLYILSMFLAVLCAICGTPLTLVCFIPAMFLSRKVSDYSEYGEIVNARMAQCTVWTLIIIGVISGLGILGTVIALKPVFTDYHADYD